MKYFIDTEFIEDGRTIDLLSIGIVSEDGREFYAEADWTDKNLANDWVKANVLPQLSGHVKDRQTIVRGILLFCSSVLYSKPEFWGYYADYDWVVFCQLFGRMIDLPQGWPMYCRDIKQWCDQLGNPKLPDQKEEHNALADAKWNKLCWEFLYGKEH